MRALHPVPVTALDTGGSGAAASPAALVPGRTGFFGKLPDRGDFVRRDLPNAFVDVWDVWLQHGLAASRASLGDAWLDAWLCAPVWRFALPHGICGADAWAGVMMPSVDRAGRYFPLTLAAAVPAGLPATAMLAGDWIKAVEAVALSALEEACSFDRFADSVARLPAFPAIRLESWHGGWRAQGTPDDATALTLALAVAGAEARSAQCVFITRGGGRVAPAMWVLPQLPPHRSFANMISDLESGGGSYAPSAVPAGMAVPLAIAGAMPVAPLAAADTDLGHAASLFGSEYATDVGPAVAGEPPGGAFDQLFDDRSLDPLGADAAPMPPAEQPVRWMQTDEPPATDPATTAPDSGMTEPAGEFVDVAPAREKEMAPSPRDLFGDIRDDVPSAPSDSDLFGPREGKDSAS
ncbi:type VI secretion system-associated protein TagF [Reyranella sp. CPCC 100927]|uniref:type VI secretion system-associated protein TagF n=1 Tax=Reyranella sp. CPCC 100927 TaxID=2599616 RepID=UPI0015B71C7F|nr:type VI secretion system-associated protein TagF [Reyranella sp. CPCC 100927]